MAVRRGGGTGLKAALALVLVAAAIAGGIFFVQQWASHAEERGWRAAAAEDTALGYELFLEEYADGDFAEAAQARLATIAFEAARGADTIRVFEDFIAAHPDAPEAEAARARIAELREDRALFAVVVEQSEVGRYRWFLEEYPGHVNAPEAEARLARMDEGVDLFALVERGEIEVEARGAGLTGVGVSLTNTTDSAVKVLVPAGVFFRSETRGVQDMVTTAPSETLVPANASTRLVAPAACADIHLGQPSSEHGLTLSREPLDPALAAVLARTADARIEVRQAAVWIVTDDASYSELTVLNVMNHQVAARGARLAAEAGVDLAERRIRRDFPFLLQQTASDGELAVWLWNEMGRPKERVVSSDNVVPYLALAAGWGGIALVEAMLADGADVNLRYTDYEGRSMTPLIAAGGQQHMVERLIDAGAEIQAREMWPGVAESGSVGMADFLIERGETPPEDLALLTAARGQAPMIALLLEHGQSPLQADEEGRTPLHAAYDNPEGAQLLIDAGADVDARDGEDQTVVTEVVKRGHWNMPSMTVLRTLVAAGADVTAADPAGETPLHWAIAYGWNAATVELLLEAGADPNAANADGETPLHKAATSFAYHQDREAIAALLINNGGVATPDSRGRYPAERVERGLESRDEMVRILEIARR